MTQLRYKAEAPSPRVYDKKMATKEEPPIGEFWKATDYPVLYQLYRRIEFIADELRKRQKDEQTPLVKHVKELATIAEELKTLNSKTGKTQSP
jgi:hypothetical protein